LRAASAVTPLPGLLRLIQRQRREMELQYYVRRTLSVSIRDIRPAMPAAAWHFPCESPNTTCTLSCTCPACADMTRRKESNSHVRCN
jgi:hypothetical protein